MRDKQWEPTDGRAAPGDVEPRHPHARESRPPGSDPPDPALRDWLLDTLRPSQRPSAPPSDATGATSEEDEALRRGDIASLSAAAAGASTALDAEVTSDVTADSQRATAPLSPDERTSDVTADSERATAPASPDRDDADPPSDHTETLTPQILAPDGDDPTDEDLAVIGLGSARSKRRARSRWAILGMVTFVLMAATVGFIIRSRAPSPPALATTPPPDVAIVDLKAGTDATPAKIKAEPDENEPGSPKKPRGQKPPSDPEPLDVAAEKPARHGGPSVGRLPDLPRAQLDRLMRESKERR